MIVDEFLYALGFKTDTSGAKTFVSALGGVDQGAQHSTKSMLHAVTAGTLLAHGLEKASELLGELGHSFLENAEHMENAKVTLEALYSTAAEGDEKFQWLWDFAQKNPVMGMESATEIFMALKNNGIIPTTAALKAFGDAAAAVPSVAKLIPQGIAELIEGRYHAGGVLSPLVNLHGAGKNRVYDGSYVDKSGTQKSVRLDFNNAEQATDQLVQILNDKFGGSMKAHEKTWFGLTQRMQMDWLVFTQKIMNGGVFDSLKDAFSGLLQQWEAFTKTEKFQILMSNVSKLGVVAVKVLGNVADIIGSIISKLGEFASGPGATIMATGFFALAVDGTIAKSIMGIYRAMQDVIAAEGIMNLLAQDNPLAWIVDAVAALAIGIGVLITKWHEFKEGILDNGAFHGLFLSIESMFARWGALIKYIYDEAVDTYLKAKQIAHQTDPEEDEELKELDTRLSKTTAMQAEDDAEKGVRNKDKVNREWTAAIRLEQKKHPGWHGTALGHAAMTDFPITFDEAIKYGVVKYKNPHQLKQEQWAKDTDAQLQAAQNTVLKPESKQTTNTYSVVIQNANITPVDYEDFTKKTIAQAQIFGLSAAGVNMNNEKHE